MNIFFRSQGHRLGVVVVPCIHLEHTLLGFYMPKNESQSIHESQVMIKKPYLFTIFKELLCYLLQNFLIAKRCARGTYSSIEIALWENTSFLLTNVKYLETLSKALAVLSKSAPFQGNNYSRCSFTRSLNQTEVSQVRFIVPCSYIAHFQFITLEKVEL